MRSSEIEVFARRIGFGDPPRQLHRYRARRGQTGRVCAQRPLSDDPAEFSFEDYVADAFAEYRHRLDRDQDGDYSVALATLMAWDKIIRGLIHWDRLGRKTRLPDIFSLPVLLKPRGSMAGRAWRVLARIGARFRK